MDKFFKISERGSNVRTEIIAGLTTFFAMAYIVVTNPNQIVSFNHLAPDADPAFQQIWNAVYVASILAAIIGTLLMALYAKMPFAQACGMGLNSFFFVSFILPEIITGGDVIKESIGAFPRVVLSEGEYRAIAKNEGKVFERSFNVVNGVDGEVEVIGR